MKLFFLLSVMLLPFLGVANSKIDSLQSALEINQRNDSLRVDILNNLGYEYWIVNPIQSIIYGQQAKALAIAIEYENGLAFSNRVIGVAHWAQGSYDEGLRYLFESLEVYQALNDSLGAGNCQMNIGLIYSDRNDYDKALLFCFEALKVFEQLDKEVRAATTYTKIATIFIEKNEITVARDFLKRAEKIHSSADFNYGLMEVYNRFGVLKLSEKQYDSAMYFLDRSLVKSDQIDDVEGKTKSLIDYAKVYLKLDNFSKAEEYLQESLIYAKAMNSHKWLKEIYESLQLIYRRRGNLAKALFYYDQFVQVKDSIFNEQIIHNISKLETELATAEQKRLLDAREQQIVILKQKTALQNVKIGWLIFVILTGGAFSFLIIQSRRKSTKRREEEAKREVEQARQKLEFKNRELMSYTVNFVQKNQLFEDLISTIQEVKKKPSDNLKRDLLDIEKVVKRHIQVDRDWEDFKLRFENLHTGFFEKLKQQSSSLTNNDLKLSVLVKMNFSIKEIADMMGISAESIKTSRYRLKKKLKLPQDQNLNDFLNNIS